MHTMQELFTDLSNILIIAQTHSPDIYPKERKTIIRLFSDTRTEYDEHFPHSLNQFYWYKNNMKMLITRMITILLPIQERNNWSNEASYVLRLMLEHINHETFDSIEIMDIINEN